MAAADCLFCKIASEEIPAEIVYTDDDVLAFKDINPQAPLHVLIIPRRHVATINDATEDHIAVFGRLFLAAGKIAAEAGVDESGYRVAMNCNEDGGQTVYHVHMHLLGGRRLGWPPG